MSPTYQALLAELAPSPGVARSSKVAKGLA